jgi:hypothetical protein
MLGEFVEDLLAEEEVEELGFGDVGGEFDVIEATLAKLINDKGLVVFEDDEIHDFAPGLAFGRTRFASHGQLSKLGFALLNANGFEFIDKLQQLFLPTDELGTRFSALAIGNGEIPDCLKVFRGRREVAWPALAAIGEHRADMKFATVAVARRLAALSLQGIERARQERIALEASLKEARQELLDLEEFGAEGTESLVHGYPGERAICRSI